MKQRLKRIFRDRSGAITILYIGLAFVMMLLVFLLLEMGAVYENYDYAMDVLQRATNSAVEACIDDAYRADHILKLRTDAAAQTFRQYVQSDFSDKYTITIEAIDCTETPPTLTASGSGTFSTVFSQFGFEDFSFSYRVTSTNYDLDE